MPKRTSDHGKHNRTPLLGGLKDSMNALAADLGLSKPKKHDTNPFGDALREIIEKEKPDYIVPEVEAIATRTLMELEEEGYHVIPTARATWLTMNREGIRRLAAEELGLPTSPYRFAETEEEFKEAVKVIGMPCVVKPIMSSSGHGQSVVREEKDIGIPRPTHPRLKRYITPLPHAWLVSSAIEGRHR